MRGYIWATYTTAHIIHKHTTVVAHSVCGNLRQGSRASMVGTGWTDAKQRCWCLTYAGKSHIQTAMPSACYPSQQHQCYHRGRGTPASKSKHSQSFASLGRELNCDEACALQSEEDERAQPKPHRLCRDAGLKIKGRLGPQVCYWFVGNSV